MIEWSGGSLRKKGLAVGQFKSAFNVTSILPIMTKDRLESLGNHVFQFQQSLAEVDNTNTAEFPQSFHAVIAFFSSFSTLGEIPVRRAKSNQSKLPKNVFPVLRTKHAVARTAWFLMNGSKARCSNPAIIW